MVYRAHLENRKTAEAVQKIMSDSGVICGMIYNGCVYKNGAILEIPCHSRFLFDAVMVDFDTLWRWEG